MIEETIELRHQTGAQPRDWEQWLIIRAGGTVVGCPAGAESTAGPELEPWRRCHRMQRGVGEILWPLPRAVFQVPARTPCVLASLGVIGSRSPGNVVP